MTTRLVRAPSAPSQASADGAWPSVCFHGWKWSLTKTESKPSSSARHENASSSFGPNCSAEALYPSFSNARSFDYMKALPRRTRRTHGLCKASEPRRPLRILRDLCAEAFSSLNLRQHLFAEATHLGDHRVGAVAGEIEIDVTDAEITVRPQIGNHIRCGAGEQPALAIVCARRQCAAPRGDAIS